MDIDLHSIDWHKTGLLVAGVVLGLLALWLAWHITRFLLRLALFLGILGLAVALVAWWMQRH